MQLQRLLASFGRNLFWTAVRSPFYPFVGDRESVPRNEEKWNAPIACNAGFAIHV